MFHYSEEEIHMAVGSAAGLLWSANYVLVILRARKDKAYGMPLVPMCVNIVWEFLFAFIYPAQGGDAEDWVSMAVMTSWVLLDFGIVLTYFAYWKCDWPSSLPSWWRFPMVGATAAASACIIVGMQWAFGNPEGGVYASFAENLLMSAVFLQMLFRRGSSLGQSTAIALTKLFGTACASLYWIALGKDDLLWYSLYLSILALDTTYFFLLRAKIREERRLAAA